MRFKVVQAMSSMRPCSRLARSALQRARSVGFSVWRHASSPASTTARCRPSRRAVIDWGATIILSGRAMVVVMRWLPGITCSVEGLEHLPEGPSIILCRHESTWETLAFLALFTRRISFVFKEDLLRIPFFGWALRGLDMVSLNRGSPRQAHLAVTQECAERLSKGDVVFPEGIRVPHGAPLRLTSGGIRLACATGAPVVPVVHNAGKVWPAKGRPDGVGHIRVVVGPEFSPRDTSQRN
jgi:1-acyl-sn-glycerol-3-phosphate acyltransferase